MVVLSSSDHACLSHMIVLSPMDYACLFGWFVVVVVVVVFVFWVFLGFFLRGRVAVRP